MVVVTPPPRLVSVILGGRSVVVGNFRDGPSETNPPSNRSGSHVPERSTLKTGLRLVSVFVLTFSREVRVGHPATGSRRRGFVGYLVEVFRVLVYW